MWSARPSSSLSSLPSLRSEAVGIGWRRPIAAGLWDAHGSVDFIEVIAENLLRRRAQRAELAALSRVWPIVVHGVSLSLGSAAGIDDDHARALGALARELRAPFVSEHIAFVRAGGLEIGHLTQLPRTREAVGVLKRNAARAQKLMGVPLVLENVAWSVLPPGSEMDEPSFIEAVLEATGCGLLLDVSNLHANALNEGLDPLHVLQRYPLHRTVQLHVAGGRLHDGFVFDTHADPVSDAVLSLVAQVVRMVGPRPMLLERDRAFDLDAQLREVELLRAAQGSAGAALLMAARHPLPANAKAAERAEAPALAELQVRLARALKDGVDDALFQSQQLQRSRAILARKQRDHGEGAPMMERT